LLSGASITGKLPRYVNRVTLKVTWINFYSGGFMLIIIFIEFWILLHTLVVTFC
jgi:hypothetical protein